MYKKKKKKKSNCKEFYKKKGMRTSLCVFAEKESEWLIISINNFMILECKLMQRHKYIYIQNSERNQMRT